MSKLLFILLSFIIIPTYADTCITKVIIKDGEVVSLSNNWKRDHNLSKKIEKKGTYIIYVGEGTRICDLDDFQTLSWYDTLGVEIE